MTGTCTICSMYGVGLGTCKGSTNTMLAFSILYILSFSCHSLTPPTRPYTTVHLLCWGQVEAQFASAGWEYLKVTLSCLKFTLSVSKSTTLFYNFAKNWESHRKPSHEGTQGALLWPQLGQLQDFRFNKFNFSGKHEEIWGWCYTEAQPKQIKICKKYFKFVNQKNTGMRLVYSNSEVVLCATLIS